MSSTFLWNIITKIDCNLCSQSRISTVSQRCLLKWCKIGYISYCSLFCMSVGMSGQAQHSCSCELIIHPSTPGQKSSQPIHHGSQNTFQAISQQPTRIWKNLIYFLKVPSAPNATIPLSRPLLLSRAGWEVVEVLDEIFLVMPHVTTQEFTRL